MVATARIQILQGWVGGWLGGSSRRLLFGGFISGFPFITPTVRVPTHQAILVPRLLCKSSAYIKQLGRGIIRAPCYAGLPLVRVRMQELHI